jgi:hypothetical protein
MGEACSTNGHYRLLVGKPKERRPLGRPRCRWVLNIKIDLEGWDGVVKTGLGLARDRSKRIALVNAIMNLWVP